MEIDGFSSSVTPTVNLEPPIPPEETPPEPLVSELSSLSEEPPLIGDEELPGVILHLMEGHYKGVSQLRLQINFADLLAAIEQEQIQAAAAEQIDNMLGTIGETIEGLFGTGEATEGAEEEPLTATAEEPPTEEQSATVLESQGTFVLAVDLSKQDFMTSEVPSQDALLEGLNDAFDTFVTSLISVFEPEPEPEPVDGPAETTLTEGAEGDIVSEEPPVESEFDYQGFIESLTSIFLLATAELVNAMDAVNILPELSEPNGDGGAYAKFLAIYNELQGPEGPLDVVL